MAAQQVAEVTAQMEFEQSHVHEYQHKPDFHIEQEAHHEHYIEMKEGHVCSADCPEHGHHSHDHEGHHHETVHEKEHTIAQKSAEHACGADCPEHGHSHHKEHVHHHHDAKEQQPTHDHHIERKAHVCSADCPEHGHTHAMPEHEHHEHHIETKSHEHKCSPDCPEHGNAHAHHEHERQAASNEMEHLAYHETAEAPKQVRTEQVPADTVPYRRAEEAIRQAQLAEVEEYAIAQTFRHEQQSLTAASENEPVTQEALLASELVQHRGTTDPEPIPDTLLPLVESEAVPAVDADSMEQPFLVTVTQAETMQEPLLTEVDLSSEATEPLHMQAAETVIALHDEAGNEQAVASVEKTVETLAEAVSQRIDDVEEQIVAAAPERAQEIRKTLSILTNLQAVPVHERSLQAIQKQVIHLLRLLGYENPAETLATYMHQYGIDFTDELLARLLELVGQGRFFESLPIFQPHITQQGGDISSIIGMVAVFLAWVGERVSPRSYRNCGLLASGECFRHLAPATNWRPA